MRAAVDGRGQGGGHRRRADGAHAPASSSAAGAARSSSSSRSRCRSWSRSSSSSSLGADAQRHDARRAWRSRSASWSTTPRSRSRTSTATWRMKQAASSAPSSTARRRSRCPRSSRRSASASSSCRSSSSPGAAQVALRAARDGRRLRDADVVLPVAHARADDGALPAAARGDAPRDGHADGTRSRRASSRRFERGFDAPAHASTAAGSPGRSQHRALVVVGLPAPSSSASLALFPLRRARLLPQVDAGLIKLHVRGAPGHAHRGDRAQVRRRSRTPSGRSSRRDEIDDDARQHRASPYSGLNLSLSEGALISSADGEILIALKEDHAPDGRLRAQAPRDARATTSRRRRSSSSRPTSRPRCSTSASPRPSTCRSSAPSATRRRPTRVAQQLAERVDAHPGRRRRPPRPGAASSRSCASTSTARWPGSSGLTERDVAERSAGVARVERASCRPASGSTSAASSTSSPCRRRSTESTRSTRSNTTPDLDRRRRSRSSSSNIAPLSRTEGPVNITHYNVARTFDVQANVDGTDLGSVAGAVAEGRRRAAARRCRAARRSRIKGQVESMESSFRGPRLRPRLRDRARLPAHGRQLPVVARPARHPDGAAGRARGHRLDALPVAHDAQRAGADGRDHVRRRRHREQHPGRHLRQRPARRRARRARRPRSPPG